MFTCPICKESLQLNGKSLVCDNNHCFDYAKQGYVNLLPVQQKKSLHPGDTKEMLLARKNFLSNGHYEKILDKVASLIKEYCSSFDCYLDCGCGEGYYTCGIEERTNFANVIGTDIAKDAVRMCCSRSKDINWTVATASHLPIKDNSVDAITAIFSLLVPEEYSRVLKSGGIVVEVTAGNNHLIELKQQIYDTVFKQDKHQKDVGDIFDTLYQGNIDFKLHIEGDDLKNLLTMTPHINRIKEEKKSRLFSLNSLDLTVDCQVRVLKKP
ncbi:MAG: methyltransferase domain-containing protein [Ruminococcus sp.]|nr:methyltransferase domain-containing protein [Ruminococcus sp.]MDD5890574.1 methyltransferase domain-containing protein [Ruminococcus sp.]